MKSLTPRIFLMIKRKDVKKDISFLQKNIIFYFCVNFFKRVHVILPNKYVQRYINPRKVKVLITKRKVLLFSYALFLIIRKGVNFRRGCEGGEG